MGFSFSLQALLNWKQSLEEYSQMRLAQMITRLRAQEEEIEKLTLKRISYEQKLKEKSRQGIRGEEYRLYKQFAEDSRLDLLSKEERKKETIKEIDKEREKLVTLTKEKKILEKLKEKQFKYFMYQAEKAEQKQNDEMTTMKYKPSSQRRTS